VKSLPRAWRVPATGFSFLVFGCGALVLGVLLGAWLFIRRPAPERRVLLVRGAIRYMCKVYIGMLKGLGLLTYHYEGFDTLLSNGKLIVANHPTLLDAVFLMALIPNATFIVKAAMANHPFTGGIARLAGYIPNNEDGIDLLENAVNALQRGDALVIFPAGTRTTGRGVKFKRGAANIAVASRCPIVPLRIRCQPATLGKNDKWYHVPPRKPHFEFYVLPEFAVQDVIDINRPTGVQARHLNQYLETCLEPFDELPGNSSAGA